jgi:hypothetical protein
MSFSPNLRIELINTGDQVGVWGVTTNTNLGTLVEDAIAGYTSVSITNANQALTANDGAADQSRNATIALTTTTGANFNVYAPPAEKQYTIYNASSYVATFGCWDAGALPTLSYAGTQVTIPAGATVTIWADGTNFAFQNDYLDTPTIKDATLSDANLTGTPLAPTAAAKVSTTQVSTTAFVDRLRSFLTSSTTGTAVVTDRGCLLPLTSSITIPNSVFSANDAFTIFNNTSSTINITQGAGVTMYWAGPGTTGTRTLAGRGLCTVIFISSSVCVVSGAGLT